MMVDQKQPINRAEHERLALRVFTALHEILNGTAGRAEWKDVADAVNIVEALCDLGKLRVDIEMPRVISAIAGLQHAIKLPEGRMGMHALEGDRLRYVVSTYDGALAKFSRATLKEAREMVVRKTAISRAEANSGVIVVGD